MNIQIYSNVKVANHAFIKKGLFLLLVMAFCFGPEVQGQVASVDTLSEDSIEVPTDPTELLRFLSKRAVREQRNEDFILRGVNVVFRKKRRWKVKRNRCVRISEGKIEKMRHRWLWMPRRGAIRIEGVRRKFMAPGLIDMHTHNRCDNMMRLAFLRYGVTTIRNMDFTVLHDRERAMFDSRIFITPEVYCGWDLENYLDYYPQGRVPDIDFLFGIVECTPLPDTVLMNLGPQPLYLALELPFGCSMEPYMDRPEVRTYEGMNPFLAPIWPGGKANEANIKRAGNLRGQWLVPCGVSTAGPWETKSFVNTYLNNYDPGVPPRIFEEWYSALLPRSNGTRINPGRMKTFHSDRMWVLARLIKSGAPLLPGSETGSGLPLVYPGFSLHEELRLFQGLGMKSKPLMDAASIESAMALGREGVIGKVARGHRADLVILDRNPLENIEHYREIHGVMTNGFWLGPQEMDWIKTSLGEKEPLKPRKTK